MHGLGNDFVILDGRTRPLTLRDAAVRRLADRRTGVGFDQLIVLEAAARADADVAMRILNADGSEVAACGNATRCVAWLLSRESGRQRITIETAAGRLLAEMGDDDQVSVNMGAPRIDWREIPLALPTDTLHVPIAHGPLNDAVAVSMGNPHAVFFVADAEAIDLAVAGPVLEHDPLFPARCNIEVAQILGADRIRLRVWERGTGITPACGSGACAAVVAAARRGLMGRQAEVIVDGGSLTIAWLDDGTVQMTGPVALAYSGTIAQSLLS